MSFYLGYLNNVISEISQVFDLLDERPEHSANQCVEKGVTALSFTDVAECMVNLNKVWQVDHSFMQRLNSMAHNNTINQERSTLCCEISVKLPFKDKTGTETFKTAKLFLIDVCGMDAMRAGFRINEINYVKKFQKNMMEGLRLRLSNLPPFNHIEDEIIWRAHKCFIKNHNLDFICNITSHTDQQLRDAFECLQVTFIE